MGEDIMEQNNDDEREGAKRSTANRRNAARSTGPKTHEGKKRVRQNAVRHGLRLLSREVLIRKGDGKENEREFRALLKEVRDDRQPSGVLEETQVEIIVDCLWTLRRCQRCETAALRSRFDTAHLDYEKLLNERFEHAVLVLVQLGSRKQLLEMSRGIRYLIEALEATRTELEETGHMSPDTYHQLQLCYSKKNFVARCEEFVGRDVLKAAHDGHAQGDVPPDPGLDVRRQVALEEIEAKVSQLQEYFESTLEMEELERERRMASFSIPSAEEAQKLLRYRTAIERRLYKAMDQLAALQGRRKD